MWAAVVVALAHSGAAWAQLEPVPPGCEKDPRWILVTVYDVTLLIQPDDDSAPRDLGEFIGTGPFMLNVCQITG